MPTHLIIGAGAGLISAALFASAATSATLAGILFFFYLSPLPLCLAGLGWGRFAVLLAALTGMVVIAAGLGPGAASAFALAIAAPIAVLTHLILLSRPVTTPDGEPTELVEWYPPGRVVGWAAVMAAVLAGLVVLSLGPDEATYRESIRGFFDPDALKRIDPEGKVFTPETLDRLPAVLAQALPASFAVVWLTITLFCLWLAGFIVDASGRALRPWPNLHELEIPNVFVAVFAAAIIASFVPGTIGLLATGLAGAMMFAYTLQGLAVIHVYSRGVPFRPFLLAVVYMGILLLGWVAILVAILGLGEPLFGLRARSAKSPPPDDDEHND